MTPKAVRELLNKAEELKQFAMNQCKHRWTDFYYGKSIDGVPTHYVCNYCGKTKLNPENPRNQ